MLDALMIVHFQGGGIRLSLPALQERNLRTTLGALQLDTCNLRPEMFLFLAIKKPVGKTKEELALEKKRELEKRLQDVSGQLNSTKKPPKKGEYPES